MHCPFCKHTETTVIDSRPSEDGTSIRRRRECEKCHQRFTTYERAELNLPQVIKKSGARRPYNPEKVRSSMHLALRKRGVPESAVDEAIDEIESRLRRCGRRAVTSREVGDLVLEQLLRLDSIAYIRFASVYLDVKEPAAFLALLHQVMPGAVPEAGKS